MFNTLVGPQLRAEETAAAQLRARGFEPGDVATSSRPTSTSTTRAGCPTSPDAEVHLLGDELRRGSAPGAARAPALHRRALGARPALGRARGRRRGLVRLRRSADPARQRRRDPADPARRPHASGTPASRSATATGWLLHCGDAYFHQGEVQTPPHCPPGLALFQTLNQADGKRAARERRAPARAGRPSRRRGRADLLARPGHLLDTHMAEPAPAPA